MNAEIDICRLIFILVLKCRSTVRLWFLCQRCTIIVDGFLHGIACSKLSCIRIVRYRYQHFIDCCGITDILMIPLDFLDGICVLSCFCKFQPSKFRCAGNKRIDCQWTIIMGCCLIVSNGFCKIPVIVLCIFNSTRHRILDVPTGASQTGQPDCKGLILKAVQIPTVKQFFYRQFQCRRCRIVCVGVFCDLLLLVTVIIRFRNTACHNFTNCNRPECRTIRAVRIYRTSNSAADIPVIFGFFRHFIMGSGRQILDQCCFPIFQGNDAVPFLISRQSQMPFLRAVLICYRVLEGTAEWFIYIAPRFLVLCIIFRQMDCKFKGLKGLIRIG